MPHERPGHCCLTLPTTHHCHHRGPRDQFRPSDSLSPKRSPGPIPSSLSPPYICLVFTSMFVCKASSVCGISPHVVQFSLFSASISTTPALPPSSAEPACPSASESCHGSCSEVCPSPRDTTTPELFFKLWLFLPFPTVIPGLLQTRTLGPLKHFHVNVIPTTHPCSSHLSALWPVPLIHRTFYYLDIRLSLTQHSCDSSTSLWWFQLPFSDPDSILVSQFSAFHSSSHPWPFSSPHHPRHCPDFEFLTSSILVSTHCFLSCRDPSSIILHPWHLVTSTFSLLRPPPVLTSPLLSLDSTSPFLCIHLQFFCFCSFTCSHLGNLQSPSESPPAPEKLGVDGGKGATVLWFFHHFPSQSPLSKMPIIHASSSLYSPRHPSPPHSQLIFFFGLMTNSIYLFWTQT